MLKVKDASLIKDAREIFADRDKLQACLTQVFIATLPQDQELRNAFINPIAGTKASAVLDAMQEAHDSLITLVIAALEAADSDKTPSMRPTRYPAGSALDPDFREPIVSE